MKQTHKRKALGNIAAVVASSATLTEASAKLGVHRSSLHRWIASGQVPRPGTATDTASNTSVEPVPEHDERAERLARWKREVGGPLDPRRLLRTDPQGTCFPQKSATF